MQVFELPGGLQPAGRPRPLGEADRLRFVIRRAFGWSLSLVVVLALLGGWFVTRRVLGPHRRHDGDDPRSIMEGNLSGRLASPARTTNSTGWPATSTPCSTGSRS